MRWFLSCTWAWRCGVIKSAAKHHMHQGISVNAGGMCCGCLLVLQCLFSKELCKKQSRMGLSDVPAPALRRLLPVKFRPYDVKLNPNNSASAADAARMILGNKGETVEETMAKLASPIVRFMGTASCRFTAELGFGQQIWL